MLNLRDIKSPIESELKEFKVFFQEIMTTDNRLLNIILQYILRHKGKQLRPILVLLTAKMIGEINEKTLVAASLVELLHTATLVHDDVVDNSQIRRSGFSIKALWKSKLAVLVGDYLLSKGLLLSVKYKAYDILEIVSTAVKEMSEGELLQIENSRKINLSIDQYYEVINKKTASLIIAATKSGAASVSDETTNLEIFEQVGKRIGIAFQIKDDLFDYEGTEKIGKPTGNDIQESKMTLPLLYALEIAENKERNIIIRILKKSKKTKEEIKKVQYFVERNEGINFARKQMELYIAEAKKIIEDNYMPNDVTDSFVSLIDYVVRRKK